METVDTLPGKVVIEQRFVVAALESESPHHPVAAEFLERMIAARTRLFFTDLLELQLHDFAFETAERQRARLMLRSGRPLVSTRRSELARGFLGRWRAVIERADAVYVDLPDVMDDVMYYSERFGLTAVESIHAALVVASDADGIVTTDPVFGAVDASLLPIFTPNDAVRATSRARVRRRP